MYQIEANVSRIFCVFSFTWRRFKHRETPLERGSLEQWDFSHLKGIHEFEREKKMRVKKKSGGKTSRILMLICSGRFLEIEKSFRSKRRAIGKEEISQWQVQRRAVNKGKLLWRLREAPVSEWRRRVVPREENAWASLPHESLIRQNNFSLKTQMNEAFPQRQTFLCLRDEAAEKFSSKRAQSYLLNTLPSRKHSPSGEYIKLSCRYVGSENNYRN